VRDLLNRFLCHKQTWWTRELTQRSFDEYDAACDRIGKTFGLRRLVEDLATDDFEGLRMAKSECQPRSRGPVARRNTRSATPARSAAVRRPTPGEISSHSGIAL
jgi:hypothetical protein